MAVSRSSTASMTADTAPFDRAVAGIMQFWKPPPDIKKVIVSELGATLALVSGDTLMTGPPKKKTKSFRAARSYLKKRYTWKAQSGRGRRAKQSGDSIPAITIGGKVYYRSFRYPGGTWAMIQRYLNKRKKVATKRMGSSKAMWLYMYQLAGKTSGVRTFIPKKWKASGDIKKTLNNMKRSRSWAKATESDHRHNGQKGNFVLRVFSKAHNSLNPGVKGLAAFQARINGRGEYMVRNLGKKCKISMKNLLKKYPGMEVLH